MAFDGDFFLFKSPKVEEYTSSLDALLHTYDAKDMVRKTRKIVARKSQSDSVDSPSVTWKDYIDVFINGGHATNISIHNVTDGKVWASSPNFNVHAVEVKAIVDGFEESSALRMQGLVVDGKMYTVTRVTGQGIMVGRNARNGSGCVVYKAKTCLLIAVYEEGTHPGGCFSCVVKVGDYLREKGY